MRKLKQTCKIDIAKAMDFGNLMRDENQPRITVSLMAKDLGISRYVIYNMKHGIGRSYVENIEAIAFYCGIDPKDICPVDYSEQLKTK